MDNKPKIIFITGYPGTGKTTLGKKIAAEFGIPFISKDDIKEILFDSLGWKDREWVVKFGAASYDIMFYFAEKMLQTGKPFILETYFSKISEKEITELIDKFGVYPIQIVCTAEPEAILQRVKHRLQAKDRHPGHVDDTRQEELKEYVKKKYRPLDIGGSKLTIDTTDFTKIDHDKIFDFIRDNLK